MVVFGASGDLCTRKLLPALRALASRAELPGGFSLVGVARTVFDDDQFRSFARSRSAAGRAPALRPVGLLRQLARMYAEELDPRSRGHVGNYPPRLMHLALINAVMHVIRPERTLAANVPGMNA
jgi:Glucose-6-phosphate dehydrogenase, NAD binding domain